MTSTIKTYIIWGAVIVILLSSIVIMKNNTVTGETGFNAAGYINMMRQAK